MKKTLKSILFIILSLTVMLSGVQYAFAAAENITFTAVYHQSEARSMLARINALRTGSDAWYWEANGITKHYCSGLRELEYDYELEKAAMQRAADLVAYYSHTRPDGSSCFFYSYSNSCGENIAYGYKSAQTVQTAWEEADKGYAGQGHRRNMLGSVFTAVGIACVEYNSVKYWVQEFRNPTSALEPTPALDSQAQVTVPVSQSSIASKTVAADKTSLTLTAGESAGLPDVYYRVKMRTEPGNTIKTKISAPAWSSDSESVVSVAGGRVQSHKAGTAVLTADTSYGKATITVRVEDPVYTLTYNANGGSNAPAPAKGNGKVTVTSSKPDRQGYIFEGWAGSKDASSPEIKAGDSIDLKADATVYAVWKKETTTVPSTTSAPKIPTPPETTGAKTTAPASAAPVEQLSSIMEKSGTTVTTTSAKPQPSSAATAPSQTRQSVSVLTTAPGQTALTVTGITQTQDEGSTAAVPESYTFENETVSQTESFTQTDTQAAPDEEEQESVTIISNKKSKKKIIITVAAVCGAAAICAAVIYLLLKH